MSFSKMKINIILLLKISTAFRLKMKMAASILLQNSRRQHYEGKLDISYSHGRYGFWSYTFRFQPPKLELIGYDSSEDRGPVIERVTSINFSTNKMLIENTNFNAEGGDEQFKETCIAFVQLEMY